MSAATALLAAKCLLALSIALSGSLAVLDVLQRRHRGLALAVRLAVWLAMGSFFLWLILAMRLPS